MAGRKMKRPHKSIFKSRGPITLLWTLWSIASLALLFCPPAQADPVTFYQSFAGNVNFQMTGASLRREPNTGNPCRIDATRDASLTGLPSGAVITAGYLYWAGSGTTVDNQVVFANLTTSDSRTITASRTFTETYAGYTFFSGFADVTAQVTGNGTYRLSGLTVDTGEPFCSVAGVLAGWSLVVVYEHASEPLRVINLYDGFQYFRYSQIILNPNNFQVPINGCNASSDCTWGIATWEGDPDITGGGENLSITDGTNNTIITSATNPAGNQFNSTLDLLGITPTPPGNTTYGVDIDIYPLPSWLSGATSATTRYAAGQDLVLLSAQIFSVRNTPVADLSIFKTHSGNFTVGQPGVYTIGVANNGPSGATGQVTVTDTLPAGLSYASGSGTNWSCGAAGQDVTCTHPGLNGASLPDITLTVDVAAAAAPSVTNTASVQGTLFDNIAGNNSASDPTPVFDPGPASGTKQLYFYMADAAAPDTNTIQRTVNPSSTNTGNIAAGNAYSALLSPVTQNPLTLQAGTIPVSVWLRRSGGGGNRDVTVTLDYFGGSSGTLGARTINNILGDNAWHWITFNINLAASVTLNPATTLRWTLTHDAGSSRRIRAQSLNGGIRSQIALDTTTVINVESIAAYTDVAFPGGAVQSSYAHNANIRIRAVVSDPFGHMDITSAFVTLIDPNNNAVITNAPMTEVDPLSTTPPSATKTYEYPYTIPAGPNGTWTVLITANEGSEGTISDLGMGSFVVGMPTIVISKSVATLSNPVQGTTNAHAIPGAIMQYDIVVTNTGIGPADLNSVEITDLLPADLKLVLNNPIAPATFIDGTAYGQSASGLTFTPTDVGDNAGPFNDVALSNNGGSTFLPLGAISQTGGIDSTVPKINYIRCNPKGVLAGTTGGANPSFTLQLQLQLE
jgi:uncharacterized repeat protein (TIGR01451 family)